MSVEDEDGVVGSCFYSQWRVVVPVAERGPWRWHGRWCCFGVEEGQGGGGLATREWLLLTGAATCVDEGDSGKRGASNAWRWRHGAWREWAVGAVWCWRGGVNARRQGGEERWHGFGVSEMKTMKGRDGATWANSDMTQGEEKQGRRWFAQERFRLRESRKPKVEDGFWRKLFEFGKKLKTSNKFLKILDLFRG